MDGNTENIGWFTATSLEVYYVGPNKIRTYERKRYKGRFPLVELIRAKRKILINWFTEHAHIILINFLMKKFRQNS